MLDSLRQKSVAIPRIPAEALLCAGAATGFVMLLIEDRIQPIVIYLLQLYLIF